MHYVVSLAKIEKDCEEKLNHVLKKLLFRGIVSKLITGLKFSKKFLILEINIWFKFTE